MKCLYPSLFDPGKTVEVWFCDALCCNGREFHRDDGPAVIFPDGKEEWWHHGRRLTEDEVFQLQLALIRAQMLAGTDRPIVVKRPLYPWQAPAPEMPVGMRHAAAVKKRSAEIEGMPAALVKRENCGTRIADADAGG